MNNVDLHSPVPGTGNCWDPGTGGADGTVPGSRPPVWEPGTVDALPLYADVGAVLAGGAVDAPRPDVLARSDGVSLFYSGQVNLVFGDPESGKTWVALAAVAEALADDGRAVVIDLDHNGVAGTVSRLSGLGIGEEVLSDQRRFRYVEPVDREHLADVVTDLAGWSPHVVVCDSLGELLPLFGASSNSPDDFTTVHTAVLKRLAMTGAAVVVIDHLAKNPDSRAMGSTGTSAKRRAIGGASLRVKVLEPFAPGRGGSCALEVNKDRHGGLKAACPAGEREPLAAVFTLSAVEGDAPWSLRSPSGTDRDVVRGVDREDIAAVLALDPFPRTVDEARSALGWRKSRAAAALRVAREERDSTVPGSHTGGREPGTGLELELGGARNGSGHSDASDTGTDGDRGVSS